MRHTHHQVLDGIPIGGGLRLAAKVAELRDVVKTSLMTKLNLSDEAADAAISKLQAETISELLNGQAPASAQPPADDQPPAESTSEWGTPGPESRQNAGKPCGCGVPQPINIADRLKEKEAAKTPEGQRAALHRANPTTHPVSNTTTDLNKKK